MKRIFFILLILVLLVPTFSPNQAFAIGDPVNISASSNDAIYPQVLSDSKGYLHAVWMEFDPSGPASSSGIYYSRWNGDTWSVPLKISENTGWAEIPSIAVGSDDTVHVAWGDDSYSPDNMPRVAYRTRSFDGTWSSIETLTLPASTVLGRLPSLAVDASNNPHVSFMAVADNFFDSSIYWTKKSGGSWITPELVSKNASDQTLTNDQWSIQSNDSSGNIHLIYWDYQGGIFYRKYTTSWSSPLSLATGNIELPRMDVTPSGEVFVAWVNITDTSVRTRWTQSGAWQNEVTLTTSVSRPYYDSGIIGVTTDSSNRAHVGWGERDAGNLIDIKYRSFSGSWQSVQDVDLDNNDAMMPFVYPDLWDNQHFVWSELNPTTGKWEIKYRVAEGTIQTLNTTGGTITANPFGTNQVVLTVPNGALSNTTQLGIQVGPLPENVNPEVVTIPKAYTFRPHGLVFNTPATARIYYTAEEAAGADEALLQPWLWDSQTGTYTAQTVSNRHTAQNWMEVPISHFSLYGIAAPKVLVAWGNVELKDNGKKLKYEFDLSYADGSKKFRKLKDKEDDLTLIVKNSSGTTILTLEFKDKYGPKQEGDKGKFKGEADLNKLGITLTPGTYNVEMLLNGSQIDSEAINF
jgi:hypothetical protein